MPIEDHSNVSSPQSTARRRLMRGVVASAAVLPVGAGATAVASNLRCVFNAVDPSALPEASVGGRSADKLAADGIARVPLYKSTKVISNATKTRFWVKGADVFALKGTSPAAGPSGLTGTNWLLSSSDRTNDAPGTVSSNPQANSWSAPTQEVSGSNRYVAIRFDNAGNMLGTSDYITTLSSPTNNSAMHRSCWSSFAGVNFSLLS